MDRKRVLVFPCDSDVGLEILRALQYEKSVELWGGTDSPSGYEQHLNKNAIPNLPWVTDPDFIPRMNELLTAHEIDYIFPARDDVLQVLSKNCNSLAAEVIGSPYETNRICGSPQETYLLFKGRLQIPENFNDEVGECSPEITETKSLEESEKNIYTVECFTDSRGNLRFVGGRLGRRTNNRSITHWETIKNAGFPKMAEIINNELSLRGPWFFNVRETNGNDLVLLKISARISGAMALIRNKGINLAVLSLYDIRGFDVAICENDHEPVLDRIPFNRFSLDYNYNTVYVDFDDCLIVEGKTNSMLIMFLYQCIEKNKKIILITKHAGNLQQKLKQHRLTELFDEIIHLPVEAKKPDYITESPAIFIDDSFGERKAVASKTGMPVFDVCAVESLIDWPSIG